VKIFVKPGDKAYSLIYSYVFYIYRRALAHAAYPQEDISSNSEEYLHCHAYYLVKGEIKKERYSRILE